MVKIMRKHLLLLATACLLTLVGPAVSAAEKSAAKNEQRADTFTLVVMDPLAAPLSCPCVEGYAQRKYEALAEHLESLLGEPVKVVFNESLTKALAKDAAGRADLVIGKDSVVRADATASKRELSAIGHLTGKTGSIQQQGLNVVPAKDPPQTVADLDGYDIYFGPAAFRDEHSAAMDLLTRHGVAIPKELSITQSCSGGAAKVVERGPEGKSAAVISSYAAPLLEGCGTVKKGDLRVIARTEPLPFITAFVAADLPAEKQRKVQRALTSMAGEPELCQALETLAGFLPVADETKAAKKK